MKTSPNTTCSSGDYQLEKVNSFLPFSDYRLINLWDMEKFIAEAFYLTTNHLADLRRRAAKLNPASQVPSHVRRNVHSITKHVLLTQCQTIGLKVSIQHIEKFGRDLSRGLTVEQFKTALDTISQTIQ